MTTVSRHDRLGLERRLGPRPTVAAGRAIALGFPNRYEVGMSNLGFQWAMRVLEPEVGVERFFVDGDEAPATLESGSPLAAFPVIAFSVSWEMDYPLVLRALRAAGIPLLREARGPRDPVVVFGGNCARINPAPLERYVDVVAAGDVEKLAPTLVDAIREGGGRRDAVLERLAGEAGFFLPGRPDPPAWVHIQQKRPGESFGPPHSIVLTPDTELSDKLLIEIARGCTEMCRFCWAAYAFAPIVRHSAADILAIAERGRALTDRVGLIATAVADHPEILDILHGLSALEFHIALSSIKIDAIHEELLAILHAQGERALAIAPEAGNETLRRHVNKKVGDDVLDRKMRLIFATGFTHLKLYLQVGLPGETDADVADLVALVRRAHDLALEEGRKRGRIATVVASVNTFVPKPHTPFEGEPLAPLPEIERKLRYLDGELRRVPNTVLRAMPPREAVWESYLAKASESAGEVLERVAAGERPNRVLREMETEIGRVVWGEGPRPWRLFRKSPPPKRHSTPTEPERWAGELG